MTTRHFCYSDTAKLDDTILTNGEADGGHVAFQSTLVSFCDADQLNWTALSLVEESK